MQSEPTLGEVMRRLDELSLEVKAIPLRFEEMFVLREVYRSDKEHLHHRVGRLESRSEWVVRTIGALVIGLVFGAAMAFGK
jgi:hypothetical protein